jgi:hypothetical protein
MDLDFTFNKIQTNVQSFDLKPLNGTPTDISIHLKIPKSSLVRVILQDQDLLKSFLNNIPTILLSDAVQEKKNKRILQTAGLNEIKLLQERWKARLDRDSR